MEKVENNVLKPKLVLPLSQLWISLYIFHAIDCWLFNQIYRSKFPFIYHLILNSFSINLDWNRKQVETGWLSHSSWFKSQWIKHCFFILLAPCGFDFSKSVSKVSMFLVERNIYGILKQCRWLSLEPRLPKLLEKCSNPHSLHVEVVVKLSKLWSENKNILWVSHCCKKVSSWRSPCFQLN